MNKPFFSGEPPEARENISFCSIEDAYLYLLDYLDHEQIEQYYPFVIEDLGEYDGVMINFTMIAQGDLEDAVDPLHYDEFQSYEDLYGFRHTYADGFYLENQYGYLFDPFSLSGSKLFEEDLSAHAISLVPESEGSVGYPKEANISDRSLAVGHLVDSRFLIYQLLGGGVESRTYLIRDKQTKNRAVLKQYIPFREKTSTTLDTVFAHSRAAQKKGISVDFQSFFYNTIKLHGRLNRYGHSFAKLVYFNQNYYEGGDYMPYIVTDFMGSELGSPANRKAFSNPQLYIEKLAYAVAVLQYEGLIHRDITFKNVVARKHGLSIIDYSFMLECQNCVKLANGPFFQHSLDDTRDLDEQKELSLYDMYADVGKLKHIPFSHFFNGSRGFRPREATYNVLTPQHDTYSFGVIAYTLLTGEHPIELDDAVVKFEQLDKCNRDAIDKKLHSMNKNDLGEYFYARTRLLPRAYRDPVYQALHPSFLERKISPFFLK